MTDGVISELNNVVVVNTPATSTAVVTEGSTVTVEVGTPTVVVTGQMGPPGASELAGLVDIDLNNLQNGSLLVYSAAVQRWLATRTLDQQIFESGQF